MALVLAIISIAFFSAKDLTAKDIIISEEEAYQIYQEVQLMESITNQLVGIANAQHEQILQLHKQLELDAEIAKKKSRRKLWVGVGIGSVGVSIIYTVLKSLLPESK